MCEETSKECFESVLGLGPDWRVSDVTVDEASREVVLDLSLRGFRGTRIPRDRLIIGISFFIRGVASPGFEFGGFRFAPSVHQYA